MLGLLGFTKLSMIHRIALLTALFIISSLMPQVHCARARLLHHNQKLNSHHNTRLPQNLEKTDGFFKDMKTAPVAGPNPGGNSQILMVIHADPQHHVEEDEPIVSILNSFVAGPNPGGNSKVMTVSAGPNPGGNSRILAAGAGPNPGGNDLGSRQNPGSNVNNFSSTSDNMLVVAGPNRGSNARTFSTTSNLGDSLESIAAVSGPNPGGNANTFSVNSGPNPGGNLHISSSTTSRKADHERSVERMLTSPVSGPNPGGNAGIFSVNSGPNPGGNLQISSSTAHKTGEPSVGSILNSPVSGPNPGGNGVLPRSHKNF